jgi:UDP-N-acetylmuramoyl-L-alanyl-D-glutamate--2,6-diaminopimelate ligase
VKLSQILSQVKTDFKIAGSLATADQIDVEDIAIDSRLVKKNSVFFALQGKATDGLKFAAAAVESGASVVVTPILDSQFLIPNCLNLVSSDPQKLLVEFLQIFYQSPPANIYAITGTNGKTSTAEFTRQILEFLGKKSASIGTLGVTCDDEIKSHLQNSSLTTPDIVSLYKNLQILKKNGVNDVAIEVSSIGLEQGRIAGLKIAVGAFTNFTQDHLDYHKSMPEYFRCKVMLFDSALENGAVAVLNSDIPEFSAIKKICENKNHGIIEYGFKAHDLRLLEAIDHKIKFEFRKKIYEFELSASGEFQAFNALCALGNVLAKNNLDETQLEKLLKNFYLLRPAQGRMQRAGSLQNGAEIFIDFAHSPDALENVLKLARQITKKRVLLLFGCGGDRDAKKRQIMGHIACELSDFVIITDDNPRTEKPESIRAEIFSACDTSKTLEIADRKTAIEKAIAMLEAGDILILAGKGHEKYQIIGEQKFEFDEEKIVKNVIRKTS